MDDDEHPPNFNPIVSFSLHDNEHDGCGMLLHFLDPDAMEVCAEVRFDDPAVLAAAAIEVPDLSDVELTVDYILEARPDEV